MVMNEVMEHHTIVQQEVSNETVEYHTFVMQLVSIMDEKHLTLMERTDPDTCRFGN